MRHQVSNSSVKDAVGDTPLSIGDDACRGVCWLVQHDNLSGFFAKRPGRTNCRLLPGRVPTSTVPRKTHISHLLSIAPRPRHWMARSLLKTMSGNSAAQWLFVGNEGMSSKCVLIVATEGGETDELATYLEERGFQTEVASGEAEGLIELHQRQYDIVLIDADLPGLFLDEFVEAILAAHPSTKIIIITATERPSKLHRAVQSGVTCYARKPFDREWLSLQMEEL